MAATRRALVTPRGSTMHPREEPPPVADQPSTTRRDVLQKAVGLAATLGAAAAVTAADPPAKADPLLPTVKLGKHDVTRLIVGGNPIYGYSHFNRLLSQHMTDWHTPERVVALLQRCEQAGINCW